MSGTCPVIRAKIGLLRHGERSKALWKGFRAWRSQKIVKKPPFCAFFSLQALPLSRIIGLTKEEIEHFRIVLFLKP
jgi:hypothetical protein